MFFIKKIKFIGLLIFISSPFLLNASHIIGGKITYRFLGANNYELKLTIYRDCSDLYDFDNPAPLTIFDNTTNTIIYNNQLPLFHRDTIHPNNPDPCFIPPAGICVEEGYYLDTVLLPTNTSGYTATYQRCCHNFSILNIITPFFYGTTITTNIPTQINSSAIFSNFPPIYICVNDTFNYSFSATDTDNDSLVYSLCTPLSGVTNANGNPNPAFPPPYAPITWASGFSATSPITTSNGVNFNLTNGAINFIPTTQGQYAVGICVDEYRNGILLNTNRLEIQFNVVPCYLVSSIPTATNLCEGLAINFLNSSTNANSYHWDFGEQPILSDTANTSTATYTYSTFGTYTVSLVAINTSYGICKDTTTKIINVNPLLAPTLPPIFSGCYNNNNIQLSVGGFFDNTATFNWNVGNNATPINPTILNPVVHFNNSFENISVIVSQFGCTDTINSTINLISPHAGILSSSLNCRGDSLTFQNYSTNSTTYFWDFGVSLSNTDTSTQISPTFVYPQFGIYTIQLIAYNSGCSDTVITQISVNDSLTLNPVNNILKQCLNNNSFNFFANGNYSSNAYFTWTFGATANIPISHLENPTNVSFSTIGNHVIQLYVIDNNCSVQRTQTIKILSIPTTSFIASDTNGCQPLEVNFTNQSNSIIPFTSTWNIDNNNFNTLNNTYTFHNSGLYSIYLTVKDTNNCTDTLKKINYINVYPKPKAIVQANPTITDILNPTVNFIDATLNTHTTNFDFGDNNTSTQTSNTHTYEDIGEYNYQLIVINNFGCTDTTTGAIIVNPINALYVPNSFTPNNDGLNDSFKPIVPYYKNATMQIFDRWGALIYNTNDIQNGWNGTYKNTYVTNDIYIYKIDVEYLDGKTKNVTGNVTLIR